ncbi:hypothetical protein M378DRAFT_10120 [Amanita muscaria Koide BX008]|uniref:Replication factor-A protein 1 N-terminal domain-containing protein n=1 Tax=Amanita muscaria (strain Koide BX008) TaxID=946122 RepID=A0A0C2XC39_AMAMK|nr:hypothetical protein M378DRAFT_10120 [Amanita muscaria Koide BX008]
MYQLSPGSCQRLHDAVSPYDPIFSQPHILQILSIEMLYPPTANSIERYRMIMSDGVHYIQVMLAARLNQDIHEKKIQKYSVIFVEKMECNHLRPLSALSLRIIGSPDNKIGDPKQLSPEGTASKPNSTVTSSFDGLANEPLALQLSARNPHAKSTYPMKALGSCLNEDVLREIFIRCVSDHGNDSKCFVLDNYIPSIREYPQLSVSRVCSSWRHVALLIPQLWNNVMIQCLTESNLSIAREYLSRARNLPISITLGPCRVVQDLYSQLTDFLSSYQLRELVVSAKIPCFNAVLRDLPQRNVEDLESLGMFSNYDLEGAAIDLNDIRYPKLASVAIASVYKISGCSSSLRIFDGTGLFYRTAIEGWDLLSRCPSLEEARLTIEDTSRRQFPEPRIHHQCLRTLILISIGGEIPFSTFIAALSLPSLEKLHVFNAWSVTAFQSLAQRSNHFPNLSDFLLGIATSNIDAGALLASMPHVTSVSIQCYPFNAVFDQGALKALASGSIAPRLQNLEAYIRFWDEKEFMDMVESRMTNAQMSSNGVPAPFTKVEMLQQRFANP